MVTVDITIVVEYGSPVPDVARSIQENVKKAIETMSGLEVHSVDVRVSGISFEKDQRANAELDEQQRKLLEKTEEKAAEAAEQAEPAEEAVADELPPEEEPDDIDDEPEDDFDDDLEEDIDDEPLDEEEAADEADEPAEPVEEE